MIQNATIRSGASGTPAEQTAWQDKKCLLYGFKQGGGLGDIAAVFRFAKEINKAGIPRESIVIVTNVPDTEMFNPKNKYTVIDSKEVEKIQSVAVQVFVPVCGLDWLGLFLPRGIPTLALSEYGLPVRCPSELEKSEWFISKAMGLDTRKGELGILIDSSLYSWAFESKSKEEKIEQLSKLSPGLKELFFDEDNAKDLILHMGYAQSNKLLMAYVVALTGLHSKDERDLMVFLPGDRYLKEFYNESFLDLCRQKGIKAVNFLQYDKERERATLAKTHVLSESGKTLNIVIGQMAPKDLKHVRKAAEKETVSSGNQSLGESISNLQSIIYEDYGHMPGLVSNLQDLYGDTIKILGTSSAKIDDFRTIERLFRQHRFDKYQTITAKSREICEQQNCIPAAKGFIDTLLTTPKNEDAYPLNWHKEKSVNLESFPFDKPVFLTLDQLCDLRLDRSGKSQLSVFSDSLFESESVAGGLHLVIRLRDSSKN